MHGIFDGSAYGMYPQQPSSYDESEPSSTYDPALRHFPPTEPRRSSYKGNPALAHTVQVVSTELDVQPVAVATET